VLGKAIGFLIIIFASSGFPLIAHAQYFEDRANAKKYQDCVALVGQDRNAALTVSRKWFIEGGGVAAQHCEALALYEMERPNDAATLFEEIADKLSRGEGLTEFTRTNKNILITQLNYLAGVAWRDAGDLDKAYNALSSTMITLAGQEQYGYEIYIERGLVQHEMGDFKNAVQDFTSALDLNSEKFDAFLYRAESFRKLGEHIKARLDLNAALSINPGQPDVLFESGVNYRMQRNDEKALQEWEKLISLYPDSYWQKLVQDNINLISQ
jgi:tetratricopeptide (TPR) repeat protein